MKTEIQKILHRRSKDTVNGLEIDFVDVNPFIDDLEKYLKNLIESGCFHMLNYCVENIGNKEVDTKKELAQWIEKNV